MNRFFISVLTIASLMTTGALAADLAARPYTKAPPIAEPIYNWTGFYIGGNIGYSWGRSRDDSTLTNGAGTVLFASTDRSSLNGVVGGGQIGYNWQVQNWVWGLEADIQGTDEKGSRAFTCPTGICTPTFGVIAVFPGPAVPVSLSQKIDWFGTVRGRVGFLAAPTIMLYATGGLAYGEVNSSATIGLTPVGFSSSDTRVGYTVGAGIEGAIGGNWTARLEYLFVDLGKTSGSFLTTTAALGGGFVASNYSSHVTDNILRVGVNYRFGGPMVSHY